MLIVLSLSSPVWASDYSGLYYAFLMLCVIEAFVCSLFTGLAGYMLLAKKITRPWRASMASILIGTVSGSLALPLFSYTDNLTTVLVGVAVLSIAATAIADVSH